MTLIIKFPCHKHNDPFINPTWIGLDKTMEDFVKVRQNHHSVVPSDLVKDFYIIDFCYYFKFCLYGS